LPSKINRLDFSLLWRGLRLRVDVTADEVTYSLRNGGGSARLDMVHHGKPVTITQVKPVTLPIPPAPPRGPAPEQPTGRAPVRRAA
jgi:alpha,alpha-trehalose phosphorylase